MREKNSKNKDLLIGCAVNLISLYLGEVTGDLYKDFYKDQNNETIKKSLKEILTEVIGPQKAEVEMSQLFKKNK